MRYVVAATLLAIAIQGCASTRSSSDSVGETNLDPIGEAEKPVLTHVERVRPVSWMGVEYRQRPNWETVKDLLYSVQEASDSPVKDGRAPDLVLYFEHDSAQIDVRSVEPAVGMAKGAERVLVVGHADDTGDVAYNYRLGMRRAKAVKGILSKRSVSGVDITSKGESEPVAPGRDDASRAKNRRAEIFVFKEKGVTNE